MSQRVASTRSVFLDNLKYVLIFLVVLGHLIDIDNCGASRLLPAMWVFIYSFHMPLFVFISGYCSKNITQQRMREIDNLLYPYLVFQIFAVVVYGNIGGSHPHFNILYPWQHLWYIFALFVWRVFAPFLRYANSTAAIVGTVAMALYAGFIPECGRFMALQKIFSYLPFFVAGYYLTDIEKVMCRVSRYHIVCALFILCAGVAIGLSYYYGDKCQMIGLFKKAFCYSEPFQHKFDAVMRLAGMMFSVLMCTSFATCIYKYIKTRQIRSAGGGTMLLYVIHFLLIMPLLPLLRNMSSLSKLGICLMVSLVLFYIFTQKRIVHFFEPITSFESLRNLFPRKK